VGRVAEPLAGVLLAKREKRGKEDGSRRGERFGRASHPRPAGRLVWVHAASVGETFAVLPLIAELTLRDLSVLLTTGTVTAAAVAEQRLAPGSRHQFMPIDTPGSMERFLGHWRPDLALFAESELWPTTLAALGRRAMPLALVNARMSERSARHWRYVAPFARAVLGRVDLCLAQTTTDSERLRALGASNVVVCGNLKFDAPPPPADTALVARMRAEIGEGFVLVAASTHAGEEAAILQAHREITRRGRPLLTILAPRHPQRGDELAAEIEAAGFSLRRRSRGEPIGAATDIYLATRLARWASGTGWPMRPSLAAQSSCGAGRTRSSRPSSACLSCTGPASLISATSMRLSRRRRL
jgi:3-deoxy-D-manno-octulosonic-acid transferase